MEGFGGLEMEERSLTKKPKTDDVAKANIGLLIPLINFTIFS